jgi:hypothetical protein
MVAPFVLVNPRSVALSSAAEKSALVKNRPTQTAFAATFAKESVPV